MGIDVAEQISLLMLRLNANLDQSIAYVQDNCSEAEFEAYRQAVSRVMGEIYIGIEEKIWQDHASLRPQAMDGPYEVSESVYEPHFYRRKPDGVPSNNALHPTLDPARLALPLQAVRVKCG